MVARLIGSAMSKRVVHEAKLKRCLVYINIKQVAYTGSSVAAVNISTMARPARKEVGAFLKIFNGSEKNTKSNKPFATKDTNDEINRKIAEPKANLKNSS